MSKSKTVKHTSMVSLSVNKSNKIRPCGRSYFCTYKYFAELFTESINQILSTKTNFALKIIKVKPQKLGTCKGSGENKTGSHLFRNIKAQKTSIDVFLFIAHQNCCCGFVFVENDHRYMIPYFQIGLGYGTR